MQYEINYFFGEDDLNQMLIDILVDKVKKMHCKTKDDALISNCTYFSLQEGGSSV